MDFAHKSVLLSECIDGLCIKPDGLYIDCTLGGAGHSKAICEKLSPQGRLIGIDQDPDALAKASTVLSEFKNAQPVRGNFSDIKQILADLHIAEGQADGFLLDLGVSSYQLDEPSRGFSYHHDAPLDMRMNPDAPFSAYDAVNTYSAERLTSVIGEYGEERWAKRIAQFIVEERKSKPIQTTFELVSVIKKAVPKGAREDGPHPAKRTFQSIRIETNGELTILRQAIEDMLPFLKPGGRICVITFHSLEDRIIKNTFRAFENPCTCPIDFPCVCGKKPSAKVITRKPILPSETEIENNNRARSAKLRIVEKI